MIMREVRFKGNTNGFVEEVTGHGDADSAAVLEPGVLGQERPTGASTALVWKDGCPRGSDGKNFALKEITEIFHNTESTNNETIESHPNSKDYGNEIIHRFSNLSNVLNDSALNKYFFLQFFNLYFS